MMFFEIQKLVKKQCIIVNLLRLVWILDLIRCLEMIV